jgi:PadR family transcriptional regulator PadR
MKPDALKGHLDGLILAVLADRPAHGYAVVQQLRVRTSGTFSLPEGTVYPALHRLERDGLLSSRWSEVESHRRRVYRLTRRGRADLVRRRQDWRTFSAAVQAVLA